MKNLKKALSLILALTMMCSLLVVGAGAQFTDDADITHSEAVEVLSYLGVLGGYPDGTFKPGNIITRGEMCKLICVSLNGGTDPLLSADALSLFSDTVGHWANAYIAYCFNLGIVSGDGGRGGTFRPNDTVTAAEAAKMLLVAMGYNPSTEGFVGQDWAVNVSVAANQKRLFSDISNLSVNAGLTRDNAAQLLYNGINAKMVNYSLNLAVGQNGALTGDPRRYDMKNSIVEEKFGLIRVEGIVIGNEYSDLSGSVENAGRTRLFVTANAGDRTPTADTTDPIWAENTTASSPFNVATGKEELGRSVVFYVKRASGSPLGSANPSNYNVVGETVLLSNENTVTVRTAAFPGDNIAYNSYIRDLKFEDDTSVYVNGVEVAAANTNATYFHTSGTNVGKLLTGNFRNGREVTMIDNDDNGKVDVVLIEDQVFSRITAYNTSGQTITLAGASGGTVNFDDVVGYEDFARGDYVLYTLIGGVYHLAAPGVVSGKMTAYSGNNAGGNVTVDGTVYRMSTADNQSSLPSPIGAADAGDITFTGTYQYYLDSQGYAVAYEVVEDSVLTDFAAVVEAGAGTGTLNTANGMVKLLLPDGTTETYNVDMAKTGEKFAAQITAAGISGTDAQKMAEYMAGLTQATPNGNAGKNLLVNTIVRYGVNSNGTVTMEPASLTAPISSSNAISTSSASLTYNGGSRVTLNSSTVFVYKYSSSPVKYASITGVSNIGSGGIAVDNVKAVAFNNSGVAILVYVEQSPGVSTSQYAYVFTSGRTTTSVDNKTRWTYDAVDSTGALIKLTEEETTASVNAPGVYRYEVGSSGLAEFSTMVDATAAFNPDNATGNPNDTQYLAGVIGYVEKDVIGIDTATGRYYYNISDIQIYTVEDKGNIADLMGGYSIGQRIQITTKKDGGDIVLGTAYVTTDYVGTVSVTLTNSSANAVRIYSDEGSTRAVETVAAGATVSVSLVAGVVYYADAAFTGLTDIGGNSFIAAAGTVTF